MVSCVSLAAPDGTLSVKVEHGKKDLKRVLVRADSFKCEVARSRLAFQVRDSMRGAHCGSWEEFCLGAGCYIALYLLLEECHFCDLPFPVCLPVRFESGIFTCHLMQYMHMVAAALSRFAFPALAQLAGAAATFCALHRHSFVEGCRVDECTAYRQTLDIVFGACEVVQAASLQVQQRSDHINSYLDTLEKKLQHRLDMAVGRMQRDVHNLSIDLQTQIATQLAIVENELDAAIAPSTVPVAAAPRTVSASSLAAADRSVFS